MKTRIATRLKEGDTVIVGDYAYKVALMHNEMPCSAQCNLYNGDRCCGYCYRWDNGERFVFVRLAPVNVLSELIEVVDTPDLIALVIRMRTLDADNESKRAYRDRMRQEKKSEK